MGVEINRTALAIIGMSLWVYYARELHDNNNVIHYSVKAL
jgi:hypothetical protein